MKFQTSQTNNGKATGLGGRQSLLPRRISTPSQSEIKSVSNNRYCSSTSRITTPSQSENSGFLPKRQYYQPQDDEDRYYINSEGHLQCHQDSQTIIKAPTPQELPGSKEHPIFHKPGSIKISSVEDLLRLYPNSFDRLGSLKGEYDIKVDPTVPPVQHARRKVPIESKAAIEEAIDYMVKQDILEPQIEPTPWVSSVTYPVKPTGEVRPCLDARDLNSHHQGEPQAPDSGRNCTSAGWSRGLHKGRRPQGLSTGTSDRGKQQVTGNKHSQRQVQVQANALWSQDVTGCLPDEDGPHHGTVPWSHKHPQ